MSAGFEKGQSNAGTNMRHRFARPFVLSAAVALLSCGQQQPTQTQSAAPPDASATAVTDPLASWNDGAAKRAITDFVARVTAEGGADFVPVQERIAVFDNDGTLWSEKPVPFQMFFALDRVKALAPEHPEWQAKQPFASVLKGDMAGLAATGEKGVLGIVAATHTGMTTDDFTRSVTE
jgi:hypothetical protein